MGEEHNVIGDNPQVVTRLHHQLKAFADEIAGNRRPAAFVDDPRPLSK